MICSTFTLVAIATLTGSPATAQEATTPDTTLSVVVAAETVKGKVHSVDIDMKTFEVEVEDRMQLLRFDEDTTYYLGDEVSTREKVLTIGSEVSVTHSEGLATRVDGKAKEPR